MQGIVKDIGALYRENGRRAVTDIVSHQIITVSAVQSREEGGRMTQTPNLTINPRSSLRVMYLRGREPL